MCKLSTIGVKQSGSFGRNKLISEQTARRDTPHVKLRWLPHTLTVSITTLKRRFFCDSSRAHRYGPTHSSVCTSECEPSSSILIEKSSQQPHHAQALAEHSSKCETTGILKINVKHVALRCPHNIRANRTVALSQKIRPCRVDGCIPLDAISGRVATECSIFRQSAAVVPFDFLHSERNESWAAA